MSQTRHFYYVTFTGKSSLGPTFTGSAFVDREGAITHSQHVDSLVSEIKAHQNLTSCVVLNWTLLRVGEVETEFSISSREEPEWDVLDGFRLDMLTAREREVGSLLMQGVPRKQIAVRLGISPNTVRTHVQALLSKTNSCSALQAVAMLREAGLH